MTYLKPFSEIGKSDASIAGGKGASLGEMTQAGIPVPPGFVILADAFERFIEETDLNVEIDAALDSVDPKEMHTVENASEKIQALILSAQMPADIASEIRDFYAKLDAQYVAVRSSATAEDSASAAWAGQLDSFLNTTEETLLANVQRCWASLFTPRAIFYRFEKELHTQKISVAVVVQKMVESEVSGIAFSVHPVTEDRNQLIIEAGFGLGEAIVSGSITPDSYVVEKDPRRIIDTNISTQTRALYRVDSGGNEWHAIPEPRASSQVLADERVLELAELILRIENHYGFPCDIEWAFEGGKFYITQSRPITTLANTSSLRRKLELFGYRDFTLALLQMGFEAESAPLIYLDNFQLTRPYFVGERKNGVTALFIDMAQVNWQKEEILKRIESDHEYVRNMIRDFEKEYLKIETVFEKGEPLTRDGLSAFMADGAAMWRLIGWWWAVEILEEMNLHRELIEEIMAVRKRTEKFAPGLDHIMRITIQSLHPQLGEYADVISLREVLEDDVPSMEELKKRFDHYLAMDNVVYVEPDIEKAKERAGVELVTPSITDHEGSELKGTIAYKGLYTGEVSIVLTKKDADIFEKGKVLVASTTIPDFIHAIKKAGAIIADEGGIVSHAAITSREFKIPCIIGTKIATQVLKDGDLVEVDADNGVVRILEKA